MFKQRLHLPVSIMDRSKETLEKLKGVTDPEKKRKIIGAEFINAFKDFSDHLEQQIGKNAKFLVQVCSKSSNRTKWEIGNTVSRCDRILSASGIQSKAQSYDQIPSQCWRASARFTILPHRAS